MCMAPAARANYLALGRPDVTFATKELCREFAQPSKGSAQRLKRLVRYLVHSPRLMWKFDIQDEDASNSLSMNLKALKKENALATSVDMDFAGCHRTRRSTSGGALMRGKHLVLHYNQSQPTVALPSGEAELSGIAKGASRSLGMEALADDPRIVLDLEVLTDATAAIGICRRHGLGRIRHLAVADLWVQDKLRSKDFALSKTLDRDNPAGALTRHLHHPTLMRPLEAMGFRFESGRPASAPSLASMIFTQRCLPQRNQDTTENNRESGPGRARGCTSRGYLS